MSNLMIFLREDPASGDMELVVGDVHQIDVRPLSQRQAKRLMADLAAYFWSLEQRQDPP